MSTPVVKPIVLNDIDLVLGTDNYEAHVSKVELVPTTPTAQWKGMTPTAIHNLTGTPTWVCNIDYAQDHETALALAQWLAANVGVPTVMKFKPKKPATGTAPLYTATIVPVPGPIGGALDSVATGSVSMPVNGQPVRSVA
ncbi:hypothetical protein [Microbacterium sp. RG1]|uniref:hypothetical protein n=1 Tax=Microbacterium sp. RG1 TaxID=2489212 RepID=UPI0010CA2CA9|nr:hypothetical protein [Microbacterium sp. RG1]QCQ16988.1 hypothetical protein EHF32_09800 [Microbacterium sp. RG1]